GRQRLVLRPAERHEQGRGQGPGHRRGRHRPVSRRKKAPLAAEAGARGEEARSPSHQPSRGAAAMSTDPTAPAAPAAEPAPLRSVHTTNFGPLLSRRPGPGGLAAPLLACTVPLALCWGLLALAVLPPLGVAVPRRAIGAYGVGCLLPALLAVLLSRPR